MSIKRKIFFCFFTLFYLVIITIALIHIHPNMTFDDLCPLCNLSTILFTIILGSALFFFQTKLCLILKSESLKKTQKTLIYFLLLPRPPPVLI